MWISYQQLKADHEPQARNRSLEFELRQLPVLQAAATRSPGAPTC
jgi:hypothetical protein